MKMKYFRFLFEEIGRCFVHFGELKDTNTDEHFTFLYLRGAEEGAGKRKVERSLFLCPEYVDLVVLGCGSEQTESVLKNFLRDMRIGVLVTPSKTRVMEDGLSDRVKQMIVLEQLDGMEYRQESAGWQFYVKRCKEDTALMMHGLKAETYRGRDGKASAVFSDCVMSVKTLDESRLCCNDCAPDAYGCALGCVLHQDYDVCKYQMQSKDQDSLAGDSQITGTKVGDPESAEERNVVPYRTASLLLPEVLEQDELEYVENEVLKCFGGVRFFGMPNSRDGGFQLGGKLFDTEFGFKQYFVGLSEEFDDKTIAQICRSGMQKVPVVLQEGKGLCCSGLLRY